MKLADDADLRVLAQRTPGMVGADLAKVVHEAALAAARRGSALVGQQDFEIAIDRIQLGLKKKGRVMSEDEKRRVAYHECGHALVALSWTVRTRSTAARSFPARSARSGSRSSCPPRTATS